MDIWSTQGSDGQIDHIVYNETRVSATGRPFLVKLGTAMVEKESRRATRTGGRLNHPRQRTRVGTMWCRSQVLRNLRVPLAEGGLHDGIQCW